MDQLTLKCYDDNAGTFFEMYASLKSPLEKYCSLSFPPGSEILDIGSGSGRDLDFLIRNQYVACGTEPSANLRQLSLSAFPHLQGRIYTAALPNLASQLNRKFDGILCSAVFQHIPAEQQVEAASDIRNLLRPNGRLLMSFPKHRPGLNESSRDENGRLYTKLVPESVILLFEGFGFRCIGSWDEENDGLGRPGYSWKTLLFELIF